MTTLQQNYLELLGLVKQHITAEYQRGELITSAPASFAYFKKKALESTRQCQPAASRQATERSCHQPPATVNSASPATAMGRPVAAAPLENSYAASSTLRQSDAASTTQTPISSASVSHQATVPIVHEKNAARQANCFEREQLATVEGMDFNDWRKIFADKLPQIALLDELPDDAMALKFASSWQRAPCLAGVIVLSFQETSNEQIFLESLCHAIDTNITTSVIFPAQRTEIDNSWQKILQAKGIKLIIASSSKISTLPKLMSHYREDAASARHLLGDIPLCLLSEINLYIQEPKLKAGLWQHLCKLLKH